LSRKKQNQNTPKKTPAPGPEDRLCPKFDSTGIALNPVAGPEEMGVRVVDNCPEEHIQ
jgi:hypothetical protein